MQKCTCGVMVALGMHACPRCGAAMDSGHNPGTDPGPPPPTFAPPPPVELGPRRRPAPQTLTESTVGPNGGSPQPTNPPATAHATVAASPARPWWLVPAAVATLAVLALASFAATRLLVGSDPATAVALLGADEVGQSPFTDNASNVRTEELAPVISGTADLGPIDVAEQGAATGPTTVASDAAVVYAQVAATPCDVAKLNSYLAADDAARAAWVQLMGIEDPEIASTLQTLTPLVLARDTAVTNTAYSKGTNNEKRFQAVLQAGTAVLVVPVPPAPPPEVTPPLHAALPRTDTKTRAQTS